MHVNKRRRRGTPETDVDDILLHYRLVESQLPPDRSYAVGYLAQITGLAEAFAKTRDELSATSGDDADGDPDRQAKNVHTLEGHRQTMAGVVPRLYQLLSNTVEGESERGQAYGPGDAPTKYDVVVEAIRGVLHGAPWLWVGDAFVTADQARAVGVNCFQKQRPILRVLRTEVVTVKNTKLGPP